MNTALISTFLLTLFLFCCPDPNLTTKAEDTALLEVETKMNIIMDRMDRMEAEDQRIATLKADFVTKSNAWKVAIEAKDQRIAALEKEMKRQRGSMPTTEGLSQSVSQWRSDSSIYAIPIRAIPMRVIFHLY